MTATPPKSKHPWKAYAPPADTAKAVEILAKLETEIVVLKRREAQLVRENNVLRREVHAWRKWRENGEAALWSAVAKARKATDSEGAFRCAPEDE